MEEGVSSDDGEIIYKPMIIIFYSISVLFTFIMPMIHEILISHDNN